MFRSSFKRTFSIILLVCLVLSFSSLAVLAADEEQQITIIGAEQTVTGPGFYGGYLVQVDGVVDGSVFASGREVQINGIIKGDLFTAAQEIIINGQIMGNLYTAGQQVTIGGNVMGDAFVAGERIDLGKESSLGRDVFIAAEKVSLNGEIKRQLRAASSSVILNGLVGDLAIIKTAVLELRDNAVIGGALTYESSNPALISGGAVVKGLTDWQKPVARETKEHWEKRRDFKVVGLLRGLATALLMWFLILVWRPRFWSETTAQIEAEPLKTIGVGALVLITTPIVAFILLITVLGIPLGLILGMVYGVSLYLSKIIVAVFIAHWLAKRFSWPMLHRGVWLVLLGLTLIALLTKIPFVGGFLQLTVLLVGLGAVYFKLMKPANSTT